MIGPILPPDHVAESYYDKRKKVGAVAPATTTPVVEEIADDSGDEGDIEPVTSSPAQTDTYVDDPQFLED